MFRQFLYSVIGLKKGSFSVILVLVRAIMTGIVGTDVFLM